MIILFFKLKTIYCTVQKKFFFFFVILVLIIRRVHKLWLKNKAIALFFYISLAISGQTNFLFLINTILKIVNLESIIFTLRSPQYFINFILLLFKEIYVHNGAYYSFFLFCIIYEVFDFKIQIN